MSTVWACVCSPHPALPPSSQIPHAFDAKGIGRRYPLVTQAAIRLGRQVHHPISLQYIQRNVHVIQPASLVLAVGRFNELRKHLLGGTGWGVVMAQLLDKPLYVFDVDKEEWLRWDSALGQYQPCEGMTEDSIALPTLQDKTAIIGTREEDPAIYPTLEALFKRT